MKVAVAIVPSNQDRNISVYKNKSEMEGMRLLAGMVHENLERGGISSQVFEGKPESKDGLHDHLSGLILQTVDAAAWLDSLADDYLKVALHLHSDAPGTAHTVGIYDPEGHDPRTAHDLSRNIATLCAMSHPQELNCEVRSYAYSGYIFSRNGSLAATNILIETFTHSDLPSCEWVYEQGGMDRLSEAIAGQFYTMQPRQCRFFPETGFSVCHGFLYFYEHVGERNIELLGYPVSDELDEDGMTVQYFERAKMEFHPNDENQMVKLAHLGRIIHKMKYPESETTTEKKIKPVR